MVTQQSDIGFAVGGRYEAVRVVDRGGPGEVWHGRDTVRDRDVAITRLDVPHGRRRERRRAVRAARTAQRLQLPGLVQVHAVIVRGRVVHVVSEWIAAADLEVRVGRDGPASPVVVATWGLQLLGTLEQLHADGIVHGGLGPWYVVIDDGAARLDGVCAAALHRSGLPSAAASLAFVAPERMRGMPVDAHSDVYGLGATLYFAVEGDAPFSHAGPLLTRTAAVAQMPRPMARAGPLGGLLTAMLGTDPASRPSADDVRRHLTTVADARSPGSAVRVACDDGRPAAVGPGREPGAGTRHAAIGDIDWSRVYGTTARGRGRRRGRRRRVVLAVVVLVVVLLGGAAAAARRDTVRPADVPMTFPTVASTADDATATPAAARVG